MRIRVLRLSSVAQSSNLLPSCWVFVRATLKHADVYTWRWCGLVRILHLDSRARVREVSYCDHTLRLFNAEKLTRWVDYIRLLNHDTSRRVTLSTRAACAWHLLAKRLVSIDQTQLLMQTLITVLSLINLLIHNHDLFRALITLLLFTSQSWLTSRILHFFSVENALCSYFHQCVLFVILVFRISLFHFQISHWLRYEMLCFVQGDVEWICWRWLDVCGLFGSWEHFVA